MPVFNGEVTLSKAIESLRNQTFVDFELIISDNCSTDATKDICTHYALLDMRILYIRQPLNIGPALNFNFVLEQARGRYFTWAAADDVRSRDSIERNIKFLEKNPDYVASTSLNYFEGQKNEPNSWISFDIKGKFEERVMQFMDNCWESHAIFYSVMRTNIISKCNILGDNFLGFDWAVNLFLIQHGNINRDFHGQIIFGMKGMSNSGNPWRLFRKNIINWPLPFYRFSLYAWRLTTGCLLLWRFKLLALLLQLNLKSAYHQIHHELNVYYIKYLRPWIKGL